MDNIRHTTVAKVYENTPGIPAHLVCHFSEFELMCIVFEGALPHEGRSLSARLGDDAVFALPLHPDYRSNAEHPFTDSFCDWFHNEIDGMVSVYTLPDEIAP